MSKLAFVFPGQGSQHLGMLSQLAENETIITDTFTIASEVLGYDLWDLVQNGPEESLGKTEITQPALLTASYAMWQLWKEKGGALPDFMAGHSLGEYSALVCAGSLKFADAVKLVEMRGQFMQSAVPQGEGSMAAIIGLDDALVIEACAEAAASEQQVVEAVNFNSPGQVVIAGNKLAVERAMLLVKEKGAKRALPLAVSAPSHCALMKPAAEQLAVELSKLELSAPEIAIVHNVTASEEVNPEQIRKNLVEQLYRPVLWTDSINYLVGKGVTRTIECGPGKVLSGLNKRIQKGLVVGAINDSSNLDAELTLGENA